MKQSAGILLYKFEHNVLKVLLAHPGGPFWSKKDLGSWTIPKGEIMEFENALVAAKREFFEETGLQIHSDTIPLHPIKQKGGKLIHAWAASGNFEVANLKSNFFEIEWPPKTGNIQKFPEINQVAWFTIEDALSKILVAQQPLLLELDKLILK
jgi:predicted NUDIX family NTP pyrophosphohydrolase